MACPISFPLCLQIQKSETMRLLFVHQYLGAMGGAEANILLTARELKQRGHALGLVYEETTGKSEAAWREVFNDAYQTDPENAAEFVQTIARLFLPDVIYLHNTRNLDVLQALVESRVPVVRMVHDHELYCMRGYKYNYFSRHICTRSMGPYCVFPCLASIGRNRNGGSAVRWVSYTNKKREIALNRRCNRFVAYSEYSRTELTRNGFDPQKVEIHVPMVCWGTEGQTSSFSDRNLLVFAGQLIRGKGVDMLLRALAQVKVPFECIILGDGNHRQACEKLSARLGLSDRVRFEGYVPPEKLRAYYLEASVFVVSSVWPEPFGMVGPEAMRYGLPVVAFDAGGIREWLADGVNGYLVPWMNTARYAERVEELLLNKDGARQMGRRGMEWVNQNYDATKQVSNLEAMFLRVANEAQNTANENLVQSFSNGLGA
jgi:glycosyltransferase involved in cell wall biosynthesis